MMSQIRKIGFPGCINHQPFYYLPAMDDAMRQLVFVSHVTGRPEIYLERQSDRQLLRLTDQAQLGEWSVHPSYDSRFVYYTAAADPEGRPGVGLWRARCDGSGCERVAALPCEALRGSGDVAEGMGTISVSTDDAFALVPVRQSDGFELFLVDLASGAVTSLCRHPVICHPQFHPQDNSWLRFGGSFRDRIQVMRRDGSGARLAYQRQRHTDGRHWEWIVHEVWRPGSMEIITANWPHGCIGIDVITGRVRQVCTFNAWHPAINRQGTQMAADTVYPDRGLALFDPLDGRGEPQWLTPTDAPNLGTHWNTDFCPYDDGPVQVYAPQHTHPHPVFAPDGKRIFFSTGTATETQIAEFTLEAPAALPGIPAGNSGIAIDGGARG